MPLSDVDIQFFQALKKQGYTEDQATQAWLKAKNDHLAKTSPTVSMVKNIIENKPADLTKSPEYEAALKYTGSPEEALKAVQEASPAQQAVQGLKTAGSDIYQGAKDVYGGIQAPSSEQESGQALEQTYQGFKGIAKGIVGGVSAVPGAVLSAVPGGETLGKVLTPSTYTDFAVEHIGGKFGMSEEEKAALKDDLGTAFNLAGLAVAPKVAEKVGGWAKKPLAATGELLKDAGGALKEIGPSFKKIVETRKSNNFSKLKGDISSELNTFIEGNKSFSRKANELSKSGTNIKEVLADPYVYKGIEVKDGVINPDVAISTIQGKVDLLMDAKSTVLPEVSKNTPAISKNILREKAISDLKLENVTPADMQSAISRLDDQLAALPDELSILDLDALRAQSRKSSRNAQGMQKSQSEYAALENASRDLVFEATDKLLSEHKGDFAALNGQIKQLIDVNKFLDKTLRGAKVAGGRLGKITGKTIGAIAGTPGGILGSILGSEVGAIIADIVTNNQLGSSMKMKLIKGMVEDPVLLAEIESLVGEVKSYKPLQLSAPSSDFRTQMPSGEVINLPSVTESTLESQRGGNPNISRQNMPMTTVSTNPTTSMPKPIPKVIPKSK